MKYDSKADVFSPDPDFSLVDARIPGPVAELVLEATKPYLADNIVRGGSDAFYDQ